MNAHSLIKFCTKLSSVQLNTNWKIWRNEKRQPIKARLWAYLWMTFFWRACVRHHRCCCYLWADWSPLPQLTLGPLKERPHLQHWSGLGHPEKVVKSNKTFVSEFMLFAPHNRWHTKSCLWLFQNIKSTVRKEDLCTIMEKKWLSSLLIDSSLWKSIGLAWITCN